MVRKIGLIIMLIIFIFLSCFSISIYLNDGLFFSNKDFIDYNVAFQDYCWFGTKNDSGNLIIGCNKVVTNFDELKNLCNEWNNNAFNSEFQGNLNPLEEQLGKYNTTFFINNDLIIYTSYKWNYSYEPSVKKLYIEDNKLIILVSILGGIHIDLGEYTTIIIETNKNLNVSHLELICKETTR